MRELVVYESGHDKTHAGKIVLMFTEHLARNGLRLTGQRRLILDQFLKTDRHLSREEIYRALRSRGVGRATVFRTLKMLQECGLISPVVGRDGTSRFEVELDRPHHDHLICIACGRIQEVRWPSLEKIQDAACRKAGFTPQWHRHEVFGRCKDCAPKAPDKARV
ncbi:MAG: transcriptional repressor [Elusimicrobia bacterium]|nr:transcriptional repressor [Elusimicrobiota bacterium]